MKIGLFGGSFSPLHSSHISIIKQAQNFYALDKVLLIPTYNPPHKALKDDYDHRVNMLRLFVEDTIGVHIDETERELNLEKSYAYLILEEIKKKYPSDELIYLVGSDSIKRFPSWVNVERILELVRVAVVLRGEDDISEEIGALQAKYGVEIDIIGRANEESSSLLKFDLALGNYGNLKARIPDKIIDYIVKNRLYRDYDGIIERLKGSLSEQTFLHSVRVAEYAVTHAWQIWESFERVFLGGLLHDCAKDVSPLKPLEEYGEDCVNPAIAHQYDGAILAKEIYGVTDEVILDAIRYHSTSKENASGLLKLIYIADKIEKGRHYEGVEALRTVAEENIDEGYLAVLTNGVEYLKKNNITISPLTNAAIRNIIKIPNWRNQMTSLELAKFAANILEEKHGSDIDIIDLSESSAIADYFVIATARNSSHVKALCEEVQEGLEAEGITATRTEGMKTGRWAVMDYDNVLVHVFNSETRSFFCLEKLWKDNKISKNTESTDED